LTPEIKLSIIVGIQHAQDNLANIMDALRPAAYPQVEFLFCYTSADPDVPALVGKEGRVRVLRSLDGSLIPHLWRDGILAARGERLATTTAHCIPAADWVEALLAADLGQPAVLGGTIENHPQSDARGCAIFLQRYSAFAPPQTKHEVRDPAADNALYRRQDLLRHRDLLPGGFWEPSVHDRFRAEGLHLALDPNLRVVHHNRYSARQFMRQRLAHGREFGFTRARGRPLSRRLALLLLAPAVFPLILGRILRRAFGKPILRKQLATAWFWLPVFLLAWVVGEGLGYLASVRAREM
jgi:hypothetical protein